MVLSDIKKGGRFKILTVKADKKIRERLFLLGLYEGAVGEVVKYSLYKSNILVKTGGNLIALRTPFAKNISVAMT